MVRTVRGFALAISMLCTLSASAADFAVQTWIKQLEQSAEALRNNEHKAALKIANRVIGDMNDKLGTGEPAVRIFVTAVTHKALAHAGLGEKDDALWYWHVAIGLYPEFANSDLTSFGEAGEFLTDNRELRKESNVGPPGANAKAPKVSKRVDPKWPRGAHDYGVAGLFIVEVLISRDGTISAPRILKSLSGPTLSYSALEALRQWRFEPGLLDGKPVPVLYNLIIEFAL